MNQNAALELQGIDVVVPDGTETLTILDGVDLRGGAHRHDPARAGGGGDVEVGIGTRGQALEHAAATATPLPIRAVGPRRGVPGELLTTFGQIQTAALDAAIDTCCRRHPGAPLADDGLLLALARLAVRKQEA